MVGTLIKTITNEGFFIGIIKNYGYNYHYQEITVGVVWNDNDDTEETFPECSDYYDEHDYCFYHKGRWWRVDENFYMFKEVLEGKCK